MQVAFFPLDNAADFFAPADRFYIIAITPINPFVRYRAVALFQYRRLIFQRSFEH